MFALALLTVLTAAPAPVTNPVEAMGYIRPAQVKQWTADDYKKLDQVTARLGDAMVAYANAQNTVSVDVQPQHPPMSEAERQEKTQGMVMVFGGLTCVLILLRTICTRQPL